MLNGVVWIEKFGADDANVGPLRDLYHCPQPAGINDRDVVIEHEHERGGDVRKCRVHQRRIVKGLERIGQSTHARMSSRKLGHEPLDLVAS